MFVFGGNPMEDIKNNVAKVLVPMPLYKKHLKDAYDNLVTKIFNEIISLSVSFNLLINLL